MSSFAFELRIRPFGLVKLLGKDLLKSRIEYLSSGFLGANQPSAFFDFQKISVHWHLVIFTRTDSGCEAFDD
jgi:hypothetical protein